MTRTRSSPVARLRLRLTLWYLGVFALILTLLGGGVFYAVRRQMARELDASLRAATSALERAAQIREYERSRATGRIADAVEELHIPGRTLYLLDADGGPVVPPQAADWIARTARRAARDGVADHDHDEHGNRVVRVHAERFTAASGTIYVAAAVADRVELEDRYATLIRLFAAAAGVALLLIATGGWVLVRESTTPIERSMEQMRRFMADAAHELRTPLTILRTRAEVALAEERDPVRDGAALGAIEREAQQLGAVVGDLLTLARADAGERPAVRETLYLDDLAVDAVEGIRTLAEQHGVTLEVGTFEEAPFTGDPVLVRRLLLILLDNAVKFTPAGGRVRLDVSLVDGARSVVITDTGVGIAADALPHLFERFYRAPGAGAHTDGAGLGLAIAKWIADAHAARIDVHSTPGPGGGTRVAVSFPAAL